MVQNSGVKLAIGVPTAGFIRNAKFMDAFHAILKPEGTLLAFSHGASPAFGRNKIIEAALSQNATHILFLDDDVVPPYDTVNRLLLHDKDIVGGLYLMRQYPHFPLMFDMKMPDGRCRHKFLTPDTHGLVEVVNTGFGCVLIKTDVFRKMEKPWVTLGETQKDHWGDDISFFNRATAAGFKIYIDCEVQVGHIGEVILWPKYMQNMWLTGMECGSQEAIHAPQVIPDMDQYDEDGHLIHDKVADKNPV